MRAGIVASCFALALLVSGCDPNDKQYFRGGIGTELYTVDTARATEFQNIYLDYLCRQASPYVGAEIPSCAQQVVPASAWPLLVQAGMNDIDARCDSYLAWLDQKKRENSGILAEIGAVRVAVDALTNPAVVTGISPLALAAVSAAFGLATNTFNNINSLLLQVDHTTVQSVVFINRRDFRESIRNLAIENKPMAVHALRSYLTICMPMTIAANINSTVTVFQQTGAGVLGKRPLVESPIGSRPARAADAAGTTKTDRNFETVESFSKFIKGYTAKAFPKEVVVTMLKVLCVPANEINNITTTVGPTLKSHIAIFEETDLAVRDNAKVTRDGMLDARERDILMRENDCPPSIRNYYERKQFQDGAVTDIGDVIALLNKEKMQGLADLPPTTPLSGARDRIAKVRQSLAAKPATAAKLRTRPDSMANQWTRDLFETLFQMKPAPTQ